MVASASLPASVVAVVPERVAAAKLAAGRVSDIEVRPHHHRVVTLRGVRDVVELNDVADLVRRHGLDVVCPGSARRRPLELGVEPDVRLDRVALLVIRDDRARERPAAVLVGLQAAPIDRAVAVVLGCARRLALVVGGRVRLVCDAAPVDVVRPLALRVPDGLDDRLAVESPAPSRRSTTSSSSASTSSRSTPATSCRTSRPTRCPPESRRTRHRKRSAAPRTGGRTPPRGRVAASRCTGGRIGSRLCGAACRATVASRAGDGRRDPRREP